jgi:hypothetical protein
MLARLTQLVQRLRGSSPGHAEQVAAVLGQRGAFADDVAFLDALAAELASTPDSIQEEMVQLVAGHLWGHCGEELDRIGPHLRAHIAFWTELSRRSDSQLARACRAELLFRAGEAELALAEMLDALESDPGLIHFRTGLHQLARERGGEAWLRHRLAHLKAALAGLRTAPGEDAAALDALLDTSDGDADDDLVRELYCELLEEHRADPAALMRIRELGPLIDQAVDRGDLPRAIVRRGPRAD